MNQSVKLLKHLTDVNGIAGYEMQVKEAMRNYIEPVSDQIIEDNLGGILERKMLRMVNTNYDFWSYG